MEKSEDSFRELVENTSITIAVLDSDGTIIYESPSLEKILDSERGERIGTGIEKWLHPDDVKEINDIFEQFARNSKDLLVKNIRLQDKDGSWHAFRVSAENLLDNPSINGFVFNYNEIGDAIGFEEKFLQSQKMEAIGNLAGGISHDFSNLLLAIQGYSEMALMKMKSSDPLINELKGIHDAALSAAELTRQLLILSQKQAVMPSIISINKIINGMMKMFMRIIGENIKIETELRPGLWKVKADKANIEQLLLNLVVNAKDAMPYGGTLTIKTENISPKESSSLAFSCNHPEKMVCLTISDTGIGMDKEILRYIFDPFFTTKESGKGTGLGLSIVHGIVARHEGHIEVDSVPDKGSTFHVYLPTTMQESEEKPEKVDSTLTGLRGKGERILIVEDDVSARRFLKRVLEQYRYVVKTAATAKEAIEVFQEDSSFDLLFSDVVLPDINGLDLAEGLQRHVPSLRVLMTSGYAEEKSQLTTIIDKNIPFIRKPYPLLVLLQAIRRVIEMK
jgi:two-component system cell cycle sensor histidine kinase/response regulator CckA